MEAGLPNITGSYNWGTTILVESSGALTGGSYSKGYGNATTHSWGGIKLDASLSNSIYGNSETVTPKSLTTFLLIKY